MVSNSLNIVACIAFVHSLFFLLFEPQTFRMHDKLYIGISGLATDMQTLHQKLNFRLKLYSLREERVIKPKAFASMVSSLLYEHRFGPYFTEPVVAGLDEKNRKCFETCVPRFKEEKKYIFCLIVC